VARAVSVYSLVPVTTRLFAVPAISMGERHIMWWGGLKGGLAIAIVLSVPEELPGRQMLVELTLGIVLFTLLINAPTIRPLIKLLGIDRLTVDEQAELKRGLLDARARATSVLGKLESVDLLDSNRVTELASGLEQTFTVDAVAPGDHRQLRHSYLEALRIEYLALEELYRIDLIHEYTYLDLRTTLRRDRDAWLAPPDDGGGELPDQSADNPFARLERTSLAWMREQNWLAGALAGYQRLRITQSLQRDVAGILTTTAVIDKLTTRPDLPAEDVDAVLAVYRQRLERKRERLAAIRTDFPDFYARFEERMFQSAALKSALHASDLEHQHGDLGGKAYARIRRHIETAIAELPPLLNPTRRLQASDLIERVPLFKDLPRATLDRLADEAQPVSFLPGDVVIEAQAKGNALYIITQGVVGVYRNAQPTDADPIAKLSAGDFFGEMALLGDDVRTATVKALAPTSLLRLTRRTVLDLAAVDSAIEARLEAARTQRAG
jgi:CPA1 family monovalent cation:H+ antiporter